MYIKGELNRDIKKYRIFNGGLFSILTITIGLSILLNKNFNTNKNKDLLSVFIMNILIGLFIHILIPKICRDIRKYKQE